MLKPAGKIINRFVSLFKKYSRLRNSYFSLRNNLPSFLSLRFCDSSNGKKVLIVSAGSHDAKTDAIYAKVFETMGYDVAVLTRWDPLVKKIFRLFGINKVYFYHNYFSDIRFSKLKKEAQNIIDNVSEDKLHFYTQDGVSIGRYAVSSFLRITRLHKVELKDKYFKKIFLSQLVKSLKFAYVGETIADSITADILFVNDPGYTPVAQICDSFFKRGASLLQRGGSHKSGYEVHKHYFNKEEQRVHYHTLSKASWTYLKSIPWDDSMWHRLRDEFKNTYESGDWYSEVGTQFNKKIFSKRELTEKLQLDPAKKTAVVFAHMFWDATFFWGDDLFDNYYDWFVNVLKIAATNDNLNWLIKIHPANTVKAKRDNYYGRPKEEIAVEETLGVLPRHIRLLSSENEINTFSLFDLMDYCLTVRGTIGMEASAFGVKVLTAGTGRYDRLGFTKDFSCRSDYISCISNLENLSPMDEKEINLARRHAYGMFILRPLHLDVLDHGYNQDDLGTMKFKVLANNKEEFKSSLFVKDFSDFVRSGKKDHLIKL
ncbi:MAG: hypothetical protein PHV17_05095 [Candidatus Omnitrophica bacterium]|nr:hypothetical protein [Candidatus Omnitrophota bacterium]